MIHSAALQIASVAAALLAAAPLALFLLWRITKSRLASGLLQRLAQAIDVLNTALGAGVIWLTLAMVLLETGIVILRYVFGESRVYLQEAMLYMNGALFLGAAAYTLLRDGHVRVDVLYRGAGPRIRAVFDLIGAYLFLFPVSILLFAMSFPYVRQSWLFAEASREPGGIPFIYGLKALILVFCILLFLQGLSLTIRNVLRLAGIARSPRRSLRAER